MKRIIVKSAIKDIKAFFDIVPKRKRIIHAASSSPLPETYGVNNLAKNLHPEKIILTICNISETEHIKILT